MRYAAGYIETFTNVQQMLDFSLKHLKHQGRPERNKCIMVKIGGSKKHKLGKKHANLTKIGGNLEILLK